jgi:hypothetical protein
MTGMDGGVYDPDGAPMMVRRRCSGDGLLFTFLRIRFFIPEISLDNVTSASTETILSMRLEIQIWSDKGRNWVSLMWESL